VDRSQSMRSLSASAMGPRTTKNKKEEAPHWALPLCYRLLDILRTRRYGALKVCQLAATSVQDATLLK